MTRLFGNKVSRNIKFGTIEENGVGKFNDINEAALKGIKELGVTHVWYTGVIEHASMTDYSAYGIPPDDADVVKGRAGSPYAIKDYYDVDPDLAVNVKERMTEFQKLIERTHEQGLKAIIDFVPNHVARAYHSDAKPSGVKDLGEDDDVNASFKADNNFYYLPGQSFRPPADYHPLGDLPHPTKDGKFGETPAKVSGNDEFTASPGIHSWFETVKLNYGVDIQNNRATHFDPIPNTWLKMRDILLYWTGKNVDGFRCDMAEMVPVEFWQWVIPQIKGVNPDVIFIAEIYNPAQYRTYLETGKFDFLYDKVMLYDTLRLLIQGQSRTSDIEAIQKNLQGINDHMLHFMENHDEQRVSSRFFAGNPWKALPAMVISATIDKGPVMVYFGQEVGEPGGGVEGFQLDDGRTTIFDYWGVPEHQKWMNDGKFDGGLLDADQKQLRSFYADVLGYASQNKAIAHGDYIDVTSFNIAAGNFTPQVHAFLRFFEDERLLIVNSFNDADLEVRVQIPPEAFARMGLDRNQVYIGRDMLWRGIDIGLDRELAFTLTLKPYSCFIFKIK
ncbi:MAG TPA: alpha-amylase family protein [Chryseosolibacter sp.]